MVQTDSTRPASTRRGDVRSARTHTNTHTDPYQNLRGKAAVCERIADAAYPSADGETSAAEREDMKSLNSQES